MREATTELLVELDPASNITDLLLKRAAATPTRALYARKTAAGWTDLTAQDFLQQVETIAKGLIAGGLSVGDPVAVMSRSSYAWTLVDFAIWHAGGVVVPIYETSSPSQIEWILADSGARRIFVENQAKANLVQNLAATSALLGDSPIAVTRMSEDGQAPNLTSLAAAGVGVSDSELERQRSAAGLEDVASMVYTSGTTGKPKGCEITHGNFAVVAVNVIPFLSEFLENPEGRTLMFLPLAHVLARAVQVVCMTSGIKLGHSGSAAELMDDLVTFKPTFLLAVPRIFEKVYAGAESKASAAGKGKLFARAASTAVKYSTALEAARQGNAGPGVALRITQKVFDRILFPRIRAVFGSEVSHTVSGASPLNPREAHFFHGAGIPVLEGYGLTETTAPAAVNTPQHTRIGSVGIPIPGTTIRIADDGEVLIKGIGVFKGYHNNEGANQDAFVDGFFRTGDLGSLDHDGFLTITGRKKDILVTAAGKNVAPGPLEEEIRHSPLVEHAIVVGEGRPFVSALLALDPEGLATWCKEQNIEPLSTAEAATDPRVLEALQEAIDSANKLVSRAESIRKFRVLGSELSVESGHLTPSLKLKRTSVVADFANEVEALYAK
ncbi:AMP-dependent synthetase/ligase [Pseudarthrobacter sp. J1738]|uniref:AMP-dependent synthetase/ligase n=1 Tax=unclassified Pseudarthrobacter TaxID=2647000 RepID=UPI003D2C164D